MMHHFLEETDSYNKYYIFSAPLSLQFIFAVKYMEQEKISKSLDVKN